MIQKKIAALLVIGLVGTGGMHAIAGTLQPAQYPLNRNDTLPGVEAGVLVSEESDSRNNISAPTLMLLREEQMGMPADIYHLVPVSSGGTDDIS